MKKFLSLVLTLALTMSLVVVPARAVDTISLKVDEQKTQTMMKPTKFTTAGGEEVTISGKATDGYEAAYAYEWELATSEDSIYLLLADTNKQTVKLTGKAAKENVGIKCTCTVTLTKDGADPITGTFESSWSVTVTDSYTLTATPSTSTLYFNGDGDQEVTFTYTLKKNTSTTVDAEDYTVALTAAPAEAVTIVGNKVTLDKDAVTSAKTVTITAKATLTDGSTPVAEKKVTLTVANRYKADIADSALTPDSVMVGKTLTLKKPTLYDNQVRKTVTDSYTVEFSIDDGGTYIDVAKTTGKVTAKAAGTAHVIATIKYGSVVDNTTRYTVVVDPITLDVELNSVVNGDKNLWDDDDLKDAVLEALEDAVSSYDTDDSKVASVKVSANNIAGGKLYDDDNKAVTSTVNLMDESDFTFEATAGFIGNAVFNIKATVDGEPYDGTLTIPVVAEDDDIDATASGEEYSSTQISFELPDDYDYWFIYTGSASFKDEMYEGSWKKTGTEPTNWDRYAAGATCKVNAKYEDGDVKLYVVGLDDDGVASTGKLVVALDAYDIEYSGVAGETITFDQDDFDDLLEEVAEDRDQDGSKAKVEFTNVTFTLPTEKTAGILYNNGEQIKSNSKTAVKECTDLDKVTFAIADKAKSEVIIKFKMTYDYYSDSSKSKPTEKGETVNGRVVVSVVNEDIKYSVPVGGNVVFDASDFEDFFTDEYKNGTLSYVTFNKYTGTNGILYATYSTIGYGTTAKTNDKFYYDSSKAADLDLDDVTFVSSTFAKAGEKIYLPFTAYGTKSSQKVEGCVAITLTAARTMNFIDVTTADWFYNNVKNAFTMGLIEGKTTTTFNPNDNMTWAEAVTLAARMNELYYTGKVTLSNSTSGNWYSNYESYAISKGIISTYLGAKANTNISRRDYVDIFYNALPYSAYTARNSVTKIPDLANDSTNAKIYTFYRAGILTGYANTAGKANGSFGPNDNIKRSEVATILIRMMDSSTRMYFTL